MAELDDAGEDEKIQWDSGLCSCTSDTNSCLLGMCLPCYLFGKTKGLAGESVAANSLAITVALFPTNMMCFFRENIRAQYHINGNCLEDFVCTLCCCPCVLCQMYRQLKDKPLVKHQSAISETWSSGVCGCCEDISSCLLVSICCCVAFGVLRAKMGQNMWTNCSCGLCCFFPCLYGCQNRGMIRARYSIPGRSVIDCAIWTLLPFCALCQELRHVKKHPYSHNIVNKKTGKVMAAPSAAPSTSSNKSHKKASNKPSSQKQSLRE